ncbi:SPOR domain-containing protein [Roseovarius sp.]|uniref:SPOR domain-containing protein n=1 Tax=Roseovarius sp. TaxID=1486281 RepID=UPI0032EB6B1A
MGEGDNAWGEKSIGDGGWWRFRLGARGTKGEARRAIDRPPRQAGDWEREAPHCQVFPMRRDKVVSTKVGSPSRGLSIARRVSPGPLRRRSAPRPPPLAHAP